MKLEFAPLFEPGIHEKTMLELEIWVNDNFGNCEHRIKLFKNFQQLITKIQTFHISFDIWIDGSFLTTKPEPLDIDLLILANKRNINKLPLDKQDKFYEFFSPETTRNIKVIYSCDVSFIIKGKQCDYDFWYNLFSKSRKGEAKGFICIKL